MHLCSNWWKGRFDLALTRKGALTYCLLLQVMKSMMRVFNIHERSKAILLKYVYLHPLRFTWTKLFVVKLIVQIFAAGINIACLKCWYRVRSTFSMISYRLSSELERTKTNLPLRYNLLLGAAGPRWIYCNKLYGYRPTACYLTWTGYCVGYWIQWIVIKHALPQLHYWGWQWVRWLSRPDF